MDIVLQIERLIAGFVDPGDNVVFDGIVFSNGNITYNTTTGVITFNDPGRYAINWWVATQSSMATDGAVFALSSSQGDLLEGNSPIKTGQVNGIGVIEVVTAPVTLSLINASNAPYFYSPIVPVVASLTIVQDDPAADGGGGAIIPFASGDILSVTVLAGGLVGLPGLVGFGDSAQSLIVLGATIDISGQANFAFSLPRDGTITSLSAFLSVTAALALLAPLTYTVQVYSSTTPDNIFSPVAGAAVDITIPGPIAFGDTFNGIVTGLSVPVTAETRLLLVASATGGGLVAGGTVAGFLSAGLGIE